MNRRILLAIACLVAPAAAQAQRAESVPAAIQKLDSGATLRIRTQRQTLRGDYLGMSGQGLALGLESGEQRAVLFTDINDVWRQGNFWKRGAIIGGVTGTALLTTFGLFLINATCEQEDHCRGDRPKVVFYSLLLGGGTGALTGGAVGYLARRWIKVY